MEGKYFGQKHFSFGKEKAKLISESINFIGKFAGEETNALNSQSSNYKAEIRDDYYPKNQNEPFLYIRLINELDPRVKIGFGKQKAEALWYLRKDIREFAENRFPF
jgi:hypothetical protein